MNVLARLISCFQRVSTCERKICGCRMHIFCPWARYRSRKAIPVLYDL